MKKMLNKMTGLSVVLAMLFTLFMPVMVNAAEVTITFKAGDGVKINGNENDFIVKLEEGNRLSDPEVNTVFNARKEGYTLKSWRDTNGLNLSFTKAQDLAAHVFYQSVTFEAEWEEMRPEVTFNLNGGNINGNTDPVKVSAEGYNKPISENIYRNAGLSNVKNHFEDTRDFGGWVENLDYVSEKILPSIQNFTKNTTLYALWNGIGSTISFDLDGGKYYNGTDLQDQIASLSLKGDGSGTLGDNYTYDSSKFIKEGYEFKGWKNSRGVNISDIKTEVFFGNTTLTANWEEKNECVVVFDGNGGKFVISGVSLNQMEKRVDYNGYLQEPREYPNYAGLTFHYWYKDGEEDKPFNFEKTRITGNVLLKAKWDESYTVHFIYSDDGEEFSVEVPKGGTVTGDREGEIFPPNMEGYDFSHWEYAEGDKAGNRFEYSDKITAETKLKAVWHKIYKILDGANQKLQVGKGTDLVVRADGEFEKFIKLMIDGKDVDPSNYEKEPGSTRVRVKAAYLDTLPAGDHTLTFVYNDGYVSTNFTLGGGESAANIESLLGNNSASGAPKTGDMGITLWIGLMMISTLGVMVTVTFLKKIK